MLHTTTPRGEIAPNEEALKEFTLYLKDDLVIQDDRGQQYIQTSDADWSKRHHKWSHNSSWPMPLPWKHTHFEGIKP